MEDLIIKETTFEKIAETISDRRIREFVVLNNAVNPATGETVEDTIIPASYTRHTGTKRNTAARKRDPYQRLGTDNQYPFFLLDLLTKSSTHKRAWAVARNMAYGDGWVNLNEEGKGFLDWLKSKGINYKFTQKAFDQIAAFGGAYIYMPFIPSVSASGNKELGKLDIYRFTDVRIGKEEEKGSNVGEVLYYWYHPAFNARTPKRQYLRGIPVYKGLETLESNLKLVKEDKKTSYFESSIRNKDKYIHLVGRESLTSKYYPSASYETDTGMDAIILEAQLASFDVSGLKNGLSAGYIVTVPLSDTSRRDPEGFKKKKKDILEKIESKLVGADNNERSIVMFQDPKDKSDGIQIAPIPHTNTAGIQSIMSERKKETIMSSWAIPDSRLIGIPPSKGMGFSNQSEVLKTSEELWYRIFIYPEIILPLEEFVNTELKNLYLLEEGLTQSDAKVGLKRKVIFNETPSDDILFADFTRDERRKRYGADPIDADIQKVLNKEARQNNKNKTNKIDITELNKAQQELSVLMQDILVRLENI